MTSNQSNRWQDWAILLLAVWLFVSPWLLAYGDANAAWNARASGLIVAVAAAAAVVRAAPWAEWVNLAMSIWIFIAPWALAFAGPARESRNHWAVGVVVFALALWNLLAVRGARRTTI